MVRSQFKPWMCLDRGGVALSVVVEDLFAFFDPFDCTEPKPWHAIDHEKLSGEVRAGP